MIIWPGSIPGHYSEVTMLDITTPGSVGLSRKAIDKALSLLEREGVPMHSLLVARHGMMCTELYWKPWDRERLHRMYSVTKSFVSIAVSFLLDDGLISLDDRIIKYFPEYLPSPCPPELEKMTIRNMLMMRTCHRRTTYKEGGRGNYFPSFRKDWTRSFFVVPPDHEPDAFFIYDTSSPHVLGALTEKLTGMKLIDYLRVKLLDKLAVSERTYIIADPEGTPIGGSGLMMRPVDLLSVINLVMHDGGGIISSSYLRDATSPLSVTEFGSAGTESDQKCGYGYQFWRMSHNAYAMVGLGGQFAIAVPDKDIAIVTTADTQGDKAWDKVLLNAIWMIVDSLDDESVPSPRALSIPSSRGKMKESEHYGKVYSFSENMLNLELLELREDMLSCRVRGTDYSFHYISRDNAENSFPVKSMSPCYVSGGWLEDGTFSLFVQFAGEELGSLKIQLGFSDNCVSVLMHIYGEVSLEGFEGVASGYASE